MKFGIRVAIILPCVFALGLAAHAQPPADPIQVNPNGPSLCLAPAAPPLYLPAALPAEPLPPKCINLQTNLTTCSERVFNEWNAKVNAQNEFKRKRVAEMNAYARELQKYQNGATDYARCESDRVAELLPK